MAAFFNLIEALFALIEGVIELIILPLKLAVAGVLLYFLFYFCYLLLFS